MRSHLSLAVIALALLTSPRAHAQGGDPVGRNLFPPDFIIANADAIHLKDEEKQAIQEIMRQKQEQFATLQQGMRTETEALSRMLGDDSAAVAAILAQFDKLQDREREAKRAQLELMLNIRAALTSEQRAKLAEIRAKSPGGPMREDIAAKMTKLREAAQKAQSEGRDPSQIRELMQRFEPLMRAGKADEASAVLDEALKSLEGK